LCRSRGRHPWNVHIRRPPARSTPPTPRRCGTTAFTLPTAAFRFNFGKLHRQRAEHDYAVKRLHRISLTVGLLALLAIGVLAAATHFGSNLIVRKGNSWLVDRGIPIRIGDVRFRNEWEMVQLRLTDACAYDGLDP